MPRETISRLEHLHRATGFGTLQALAAALDVPQDALTIRPSIATTIALAYTVNSTGRLMGDCGST